MSNTSATEQAMALLGQVKQARIDQGISQAELARRSNSSQRTVSQLENGVYISVLDTFIAHVAGLGGQIIVVFPPGAQGTE